MDYSLKLGAKFTKEEYESVLAVWRYPGYLMGIPETILYTDGATAERTYKIGYMCEPTPDVDSITVANMLIEAIPSVTDIKDPVEQKIWWVWPTADHERSSETGSLTRLISQSHSTCRRHCSPTG